MKAPSFFYGTAWKEDKTENLTLTALDAGFRAIDTANQRKHYYEEGVGIAVKKFLQKNTSIKRRDLFLQTKFTFARGQDHRKPYDENDPFKTQVEQSFESSLKHLNTDYIDSYVLHGPSVNEGLTDADHEVWAAMEEQHKAGRVKYLGVSNCSLDQVEEIWQYAKIKPTFIQNRCFSALGWDYPVREFCEQTGLIYQGFSLLTANSRELQNEFIDGLSQKYEKTIPQIVFQFCLAKKMIILTGTTKLDHMRDDLKSDSFELSSEELDEIEKIGLR